MAVFAATLMAMSNASADCAAGLNSHAHSFGKIRAESFSFLDDALSEVRVLGYGEDTHGTAQFTQLAQELMVYLIDQHEFRIFVIETGFGEGQYLNDYIHGRRTDLDVVLAEHNSTWRYTTTEFRDLLNALRRYNETHLQKIDLYGSEMQYVISDANRIRDYLDDADSVYQFEGFDKHLWQDFEDGEKIDYFLSYAKLRQHFTDNRKAFENRTSKERFALALHHVDVLGQFVTAINQNVEQRKHDLRDLYIAENIQWILDYHGRQSKALYWAHNAHVGDWVDNGIVDVAGHQLRKSLGSAYFNIATDFGTGAFRAFSQDWRMQTYRHVKVEAGTFSECLKVLGKPNVFVNIREARKNPELVSDLDADLTTMSGAGAQVRETRTETNGIGRAFDGILYLDSTSEITSLE